MKKHISLLLAFVFLLTASSIAYAMDEPQGEFLGYYPCLLYTSPSSGTSLGILCIGKKEIPVAIGVDEATLADGPGWMPDSALPGQAGMSVILGHRNRKHLRPLQDVEIGDSLCFRYPDGREYTYTVSEIVKYEDTADWRLPALDGNTLVLVTCYPFHYSGNAPGKYVVVADII